MILHICSRDSWEAAKRNKVYGGDAFSSQGFIHCSTLDQVIDVANSMFKGEKGLMLLLIDEEKVSKKIKYEKRENGKLYPHVYGPLDLSAVISAVDFPPQPDGTFIFPELIKIV